MNKKTKKSTVFHQFMVSYILLLIISVLIISGISFYKTYSIVYGNIREAHFASIEKLESTMQSIFDETDDISLSLQGWPTVKKIFTMSGSLDSSWVSTDDLFNIVYMLRKHKALHPYIDNIAIVFRDVDLVIDCNSPESTYEDFFDYRYSFESELFSGVDDLDFSKDSLLIPNCMVGRYSQPNQNKLLYMKAIPNASGTAKAMLLITMTPDDLARELSNNMTFDEDMWLITDQNSNIILSGMKISEEDLNILPSFDETTQQTAT